MAPQSSMIHRETEKFQPIIPILQSNKSIHPFKMFTEIPSDPILVQTQLVVRNKNIHLCKVCGKSFAVSARLTRHIRTHTGEKPYNCDFCDKSFSVKENLSVHRRIHTNERPYKCKICNKGFEHSGKLHRHMRIHTGERPHVCKVCHKTFVQSGQLVIHSRSHTGEKPYKCDTCFKGFTCSKQLKVHTRTHTGEKPYSCEICGKAFGYNHVLKLHQVSHFGEKVFKCTACFEIFDTKKAMKYHIKIHAKESQGNDNEGNPVPTPSSESLDPAEQMPKADKQDPLKCSMDDKLKPRTCTEMKQTCLEPSNESCHPAKQRLKAGKKNAMKCSSGDNLDPFTCTEWKQAYLPGYDICEGAMQFLKPKKQDALKYSSADSLKPPPCIGMKQACLKPSYESCHPATQILTDDKQNATKCSSDDSLKPHTCIEFVINFNGKDATKSPNVINLNPPMDNNNHLLNNKSCSSEVTNEPIVFPPDENARKGINSQQINDNSSQESNMSSTVINSNPGPIVFKNSPVQVELCKSTLPLRKRAKLILEAMNMNNQVVYSNERSHSVIKFAKISQGNTYILI